MSFEKVIILVVGTLLACAAVAGVGILAKRQVKKWAPNSQALARMTPTGMALCACFTVAMAVGTAARKLAPDSVLGSFLNTEIGLFIAIVVGWGAFIGATMALHALGHPIAEIRERRNV